MWKKAKQRKMDIGDRSARERKKKSKREKERDMYIERNKERVRESERERRERARKQRREGCCVSATALLASGMYEISMIGVMLSSCCLSPCTLSCSKTAIGSLLTSATHVALQMPGSRCKTLTSTYA